MKHSNTMSEYEKHMLVEEFAVEKLAASRAAKKASLARENQTRILQGASHTRDIDLILKLERSYLAFELAHYANSSAMHTSLSAAIEELDVTAALLIKVQDPVLYREVDESFSLKKNRINGLPRDQARQFFSSQITRLRNLDKARLSDSEKALIKCRIASIQAAEKGYKRLQRKVVNAGVDRVEEASVPYAA